jgi:hypothetical protein
LGLVKWAQHSAPVHRHDMAAALTIVGTPIRADIKLNEFPRADETPYLVVFEWQPIPGRIMGAAFDWVAVLDITVDLLTIGGALSGVYEKLIKRRKKPGAGQPLTPALLRLDPMFDPLRNGRRFQKLVASPTPK